MFVGKADKFFWQDTAHEIICEAGDKWQWDGVTFEVLHPATDYRKTNNQSCVLRVSNSYKSILLTGDIESSAEFDVLKFAAERMISDILIVPHHGSNTSSSIAFIDAINPQLAVVSAGYKNRFGHPTKKIESRYEVRDIVMLNTAYEGAIQLEFSHNVQGDPIQLKRQRKERVHYWNHRF